MKDILEKLTSYNLFNYLLPGVVFAVLASKTTGFSLMQQDWVLGAFLYYFIGLVISRVGSLVIEPLLKKLSFVQYAVYADFVAASKTDSKIEVLLEANNSYRTLATAFMLLLLLKLYDKISAVSPSIAHYGTTVGFALLMLMFLFAYRKQTMYISKRVKSASSQTSEVKAKGAAV